MDLLRDVIRKDIFVALWDQYFKQFHKRFSNYGPSERSRAKQLFDAIDQQKDGRVENRDALDCLNESGQEEFELDADDLLHYLISDSFLKIEDGDIFYSSGLIPAWRKKRI